MLPRLLGAMDSHMEISEFVYCADLTTHDSRRRLRIDAHDFDFSCLGDLKAYSLAENFQSLLEWLAPHAGRLSPGAEGLRNGKSVSELGYDGLEDLEREGLWLSTLQALGKA